MENSFYIDRQFGHQIWIDVEDGVIVKFPHEGKMEDELNKRYKGYKISKFKTEFEEKMKPSFHCVHSHDWAGTRRVIYSIESQISYWHRQKGSISPYYTDEKINEMVNKLEKQASEKRGELKLIEKNLIEKHNFNFYKTK